MRFAFQKLSTGLHTITEVFHQAVEYGFDKSKNCFWKAIRNPVYCGKIPTHRDGEDTVVKGQHQAIIPETLFLKVQQILGRKKIVTRSARTDDMLPLRGLLLCPECHRVMTGSGSTGKRKIVYYYYHCNSRCHVRFPVQQVHDQLERFLQRLYPNLYFEQFYHQVEQELLRWQAAQRFHAHASALRKVEVFKQRLSRLDRLLLEGSVEPDHYKSLKQDCDAEIELLQSTAKLTSARLEDVQQLRKLHSPGIGRLGELYLTLNAVKKKRWFHGCSRLASFIRRAALSKVEWPKVYGLSSTDIYHRLKDGRKKTRRGLLIRLLMMSETVHFYTNWWKK